MGLKVIPNANKNGDKILVSRSAKKRKGKSKQVTREISRAATRVLQRVTASRPVYWFSYAAKLMAESLRPEERQSFAAELYRGAITWSNVMRLIAPNSARIQFMYDRIDESARFELRGLEVKLRGRKPSCKVGCSNCCLLNVDVSEVEALNLASLIHSGRVTVDEERLETLAKVRKFEFGPCIFLDHDKTCRVYDDRPVNCRTYFSFSDADKCDPRNPQDVEVPYLARTEHIKTAVMNFEPINPRVNYSLAPMVWRALNDLRRISNGDPNCDDGNPQ